MNLSSALARRTVLAALVLAPAAALTTGSVGGTAWPASPVWSAGPASWAPYWAADGPVTWPAAARPETGAADGRVVPPARVRIPAIRVDAPLEPLGLDPAGALRTPTDYARAGWYAGGTPPGDVGPAVIAGHVDSRTGPAVFFRLPEVRDRDLVEVQRGNRWLRFRVVAVARYAKDRFPTAEVYGPTTTPQLRLITCGGAFNPGNRSYAENVVVYAIRE